jgi:hypothetical protein
LSENLFANGILAENFSFHKSEAIWKKTVNFFVIKTRIAKVKQSQGCPSADLCDNDNGCSVLLNRWRFCSCEVLSQELMLHEAFR